MKVCSPRDLDVIKEMGNHFGYTINGPTSDSVELPTRVSKSQSVRREPRLSGNNLRNLYQNPALYPCDHASLSSIDNALQPPATPILPPTPPNAEDEDDATREVGDSVSVVEAVKARSIMATPVNQISPPTPDDTPPRDRSRLRPFLGAQPSMASTRAESFKTALEELPSDKESVSSVTIAQPEMDRALPLSTLLGPVAVRVHKPSPLASLPITNGDVSPRESSSVMPVVTIMLPEIKVYDPEQDSPTIGYGNDIAQPLATVEMSLKSDISPPPVSVAPVTAHAVRSRKEGGQWGPSLRDRLEGAQQVPHSASIDKFASIIGWRGSVQDYETGSRRWSGTSNTSTVEAFVIEPPRTVQKQNTLRHVSKNDSLRSASSPLSNSNRGSLQSPSDSPHRLVHKKARLSNHDRLSFGSEVPHLAGIESSITHHVEIIKVAVIPERSSSLQGSGASSRRHSVSTLGAPTSFRMRNASDVSHRRRATTDSADRGRARHYPPQVPPRASSLSAPTSQNTSRVNSITSEQALLEQERAETDLRKTLYKMESDFIAWSSRGGSAEAKTETLPPKTNALRDGLWADGPPANAQSPPEHTVTPGTQEWAAFRPSPTLRTPFSQPSFVSASPEISEAKVISLHHHNNHSVQLIEPLPLQESQAVEEVRKLHQAHFLVTEANEPPLRDFRPALDPPQVHFIPASPLDEDQAEIGMNALITGTPMTPGRPLNSQRTDSFKTLLRNVSLKNARNKKAHQDLDSTLHPFWRPRPFWDGLDSVSPGKKRDTETTDMGLINNSLGLPQQGNAIAGPLSLVRRISERRRNRNVLSKQSSHGSLQRLRAGRRLYRLPAFGTHIRILSFRNIQDRITTARGRKDEGKREQWREALRRSIGPNIVANGDSRFPAAILADNSLQR